MEIITIERSDLIALIDQTVTRALERHLSPPDEIMTIDETAAYLKRSRSYVALAKRSDKNPHGMPHKDNRFRRSEVDRWLANRDLGVNV